MIHKQIFLAKLQKKSHSRLIFSEKRLQRDKRRLKQSIHHFNIYDYERFDEEREEGVYSFFRA
jgi:hypothetical protein